MGADLADPVLVLITAQARGTTRDNSSPHADVVTRVTGLLSDYRPDMCGLRSRLAMRRPEFRAHVRLI